ncbi:sulfatase-like hydrolase/transferase [Jiangella asiatica]|uniref:Sulfatase n=1 Tax=Jiangella asiatica TaxID=2530372 RepID=A0A4R5DKJ5_9ACTN|nr:sulfatase-like hydrolase/transferase [Jiangella asiatica]TDE11153.1 sulfatase [Jiangella asiatica]
MPTGRPNIVLIFMDDMTHWAIGALGNSQVLTPNLDRLVERGCAFSHAVNQGSWSPAVCMPARAMLLTGRSLFHARAAVDAEDCPMLLGEVLAAAGYRTFFTGKWHSPDDWLRRGYQVVGPHATGGMLTSHWFSTAGGAVHSSERWVDAALDFLAGHDGRPEPFFLHLAMHAPHDPRQAPERWLRRYPADDVRLPPNLLPAHPFDQGDRLVRDELLAGFPRTPAEVREHRRQYYAIVSHADEQIGRLLDDLDRRGLAGDTVVVFSGDHGLALGEHGLMGKQSMYDHSVRVPLLVAGPGIPQGLCVDDLVYQASIFPTLCHLAGISVPDSVDFQSLAPAFQGRPVGQRAIFGAYRDLQRLVRTRQWALAAYRPARRLQLFDVRHDPWQTRDLAADPAHTTVRTLLLALLRQLQDEHGDQDGHWTRHWTGTGCPMSPQRPEADPVLQELDR